MGVPLRELLYLSDRKLNAFVTSSHGYGIAGAEVEVAVAAVRVRYGRPPAPVCAAPEDRRSQETRKLEKVIRHLGRSAAWWAGPSVLPGDWVHFSVPMTFSVFSEFTGEHPVALFAGSARRPDGAEISLLLCGDPVRLLGGGLPADDYWAAQGRYLDALYEVIREDSAAGERERMAGPHGALARGQMPCAYLAAQRSSPGRSHARLSGHARVLLTDDAAPLALGGREDREHRLVVATPLYVEHGPDRLRPPPVPPDVRR